MKRAWTWVAGLALVAGTAWAQENPKPKEEDEDLTPEKALALLKEAHGLMERTEELLNESARGKALATEAELVARLKKLLEEEVKEDPATVQKQILQKIQRMMEKSEGKQKTTIEKINEIIRKAKS